MRRSLRNAAVLALALAAAAGCASRKKEVLEAETERLSAEGLYERSQLELAQGSLRKARLDLERVQFTSEDRPKLEPLVRLALADVSFYQGDVISLIEARSKYLDFVTLYSDHPKASYAQLQAGVCSLKQVRDPSRDQEQTRKAIADLREVAKRYPKSVYVDPAQDMIAQAEKSLAEHEFTVGYFYYKRKSYEAATQRFRTILEEFPKYPEREKLYFCMGQSLIRGNNESEGRIYLDKLLTDYPEGEFADDAKKALASSSSSENGGKKQDVTSRLAGD
jgi:outer membrane protein assembly factor BamD